MILKGMFASRAYKEFNSANPQANFMMILKGILPVVA